MLEIISAIIPIFSVIVAGFITGRLRFLDGSAATTLNRFIFYITLPALLFYTTATAKPEDILRYDFALIFLIGSLLTVAIGVLGAKIFFKKSDSKEVILHTLSVTLGNTGYMGIPMLISLFGSMGGVAAVIGTITVNMPLTAIGICALQFFCNKGTGKGWYVPFLDIVKMPFVFASFIGMCCALLEVEIPKTLLQTADLLGSPTMGAALFAVGLSLADLKLHKSTMIEVAWISFIKLLISPLLVLLVCPLFPEIDLLWKSCAVILAATPLASTVCVISANFDCYTAETSSTVFISTLLSALTLPLFIHLLS